MIGTAPVDFTMPPGKVVLYEAHDEDDQDDSQYLTKYYFNCFDNDSPTTQSHQIKSTKPAEETQSDETRDFLDRGSAGLLVRPNGALKFISDEVREILEANILNEAILGDSDDDDDCIDFDDEDDDDKNIPELCYLNPEEASKDDRIYDTRGKNFQDCVLMITRSILSARGDDDDDDDDDEILEVKIGGSGKELEETRRDDVPSDDVLISSSPQSLTSMSLILRRGNEFGSKSPLMSIEDSSQHLVCEEVDDDPQYGNDRNQPAQQTSSELTSHPRTTNSSTPNELPHKDFNPYPSIPHPPPPPPDASSHDKGADDKEKLCLIKTLNGPKDTLRVLESYGIEHGSTLLLSRSTKVDVRKVDEQTSANQVANEQTDEENVEKNDKWNDPTDRQTMIQQSSTLPPPNLSSPDQGTVDTSGYVTSNRNSCEIINVSADDFLTFVSLTRKGRRRKRRRGGGDCLIHHDEGNGEMMSDLSAKQAKNLLINETKINFTHLPEHNMDESDKFAHVLFNLKSTPPPPPPPLPAVCNPRLQKDRNCIMQDRKFSCHINEELIDHPPHIDHSTDIATRTTSPACSTKPFVKSVSSSSLYPRSIDRLTFTHRTLNVDDDFNNDSEDSFVNPEIVLHKILKESKKAFDDDINKTNNIRTSGDRHHVDRSRHCETLLRKLVTTLRNVESQFKSRVIILAMEIGMFISEQKLQRHFVQLSKDIRQFEYISLQNCVTVSSWERKPPSLDQVSGYCLHILRSYYDVCSSYFDNLGVNIRRMNTLISCRPSHLKHPQLDEMLKWPAEHLKVTLRTISDFAEDPDTPISELLNNSIIQFLILLSQPISFKKRVKIAKAKLKNHQIQFRAQF